MRFRLPVILLLGACVGCVAARSARVPGGTAHVRLLFASSADTFRTATRDYDSLWASDGPRIIHALEAAAGLSFSAIGDTVIRAVVFEGASSSGYRDDPMQMRASYPIATKKATLMHELGHRLQSDLFHKGENDHPFLFLWLYQAWIDSYGEPFAREQVVVEKRRGGVYPAAWDSALVLSKQARIARWDSVRAARLKLSP